MTMWVLLTFIEVMQQPILDDTRFIINWLDYGFYSITWLRYDCVVCKYNHLKKNLRGTGKVINICQKIELGLQQNAGVPLLWHSDMRT